MTIRPLPAILLFCVTLAFAPSSFAQGSAFTYQGRLTLGGAPAAGISDLRFTLFDAASGGGTVIGPTNILNGVAVSNGMFIAQLDFGPQFYGADRWIEIAIRTNGAAAFTVLAPRQRLTPVPYAMFASQAGIATTAMGIYPDSVANSALQTSSVNSDKIQDGTVSTVDLASDVLSGTFWRLGGNIGTDPAAQFIGTTDGQRLELRVNNQRGLLIAPSNPQNGMVNVVAGSESNRASSAGTTIAGGGSRTLPNVVVQDFATVGGGAGNAAQGFDATVAGGLGNSVSGRSATIGGGRGNNIGADGATIAGGETNAVLGLWSTIAGGWNNQINGGILSTIGGGLGNRVSGDMAAIAGGNNNVIHRGAANSSIAGGLQNSIGTNASGAAIGGGSGNSVLYEGFFGTIPGGLNNAATNNAFAAGTRAKAVHRGTFVWADSTAGEFASSSNNQFLVRASGGVGINKTNPATALDVNGKVTAGSFTGTGGTNVFHGSTGLGTPNPQTPLHVYSANNPAVVRVQSTGTPGFARFEFVSNPQGDLNEWRPGYIESTDAGGFTGGLAFFVNGTGAANKFGELEAMRIQNGRVGIGNTAPGTLLQVGNATCNGTTWANASDRNIKSDFQAVNPRELLDKVVALPLRTWSYTNDPGTRHIGPTAQDFKAAFQVGDSDTSIATVDTDGVALAAIQGLNEKLREKELRISELEKRLAALEALLQK